MNQHKRAEIFTRLRAGNPEPTTELHFGTPFELLVAVVLSAQATDVSVNQATGLLFAAADTPEAMLDLGLDGLRDFIKSIGLCNTKAANVIKTCRILVDEHGGEVPRRREAIEALPGVGRKTANVVLNTAFGEPTIAVDTHIFRVSNRTGIAPGKTPPNDDVRGRPCEGAAGGGPVAVEHPRPRRVLRPRLGPDALVGDRPLPVARLPGDGPHHRLGGDRLRRGRDAADPGGGPALESGLSTAMAAAGARATASTPSSATACRSAAASWAPRGSASAPRSTAATTDWATASGC